MTPAAEALVIDACVAVKWHVHDEDHVAQATLLLTRFAQGSVDLLAPDHIQPEFTAAITKATRGRKPRLTQSQGSDAIDEFLSLGLRTFETAPLLQPAYSLTHEFGCAFYDALYLALAQRLSLSLVTADGKFYRAARRHPALIWIGDYAPSTQL